MTKRSVSYIIFTGILLPLQVLTGYSQSSIPQLRYSIDTGHLTIGDIVTLHIELSNIPDNALAVLPDYESVLQSGTEFVSLIASDTIAGNGSYSISQRIGISAYEAGMYWIPSMEFQVQEGNSTWTVLRSDSIRLSVTTIEVDTTLAIKDIKDIIPARSSSLVPYLVVLLLVLLSVAFVIWRKKIIRALFSKKTGTTAPVTAKRVTLQEKYTSALQQLKERDYVANGLYKEYYSELSDILRNYINEKFAIPAPELTTQEFLKQSKRAATLKRYRADIKTVLMMADMAKFAKAQANEASAAEDMQLVADFIRSTSKNGSIVSDV